MSNKKKKEICWPLVVNIFLIVLFTVMTIAIIYYVVVYGVMGKGRETVPTVTSIPTATLAPTTAPTVTLAPTAVPTEIPSPTVAPTATLVPTEVPATAPPEPTVAPTAIPTPEPTATSTPTPTPEPTATPVPTATPTPELTPTNTPVPTATSTPKPTAPPKPTFTPKPTATPKPTTTPTPVDPNPYFSTDGYFDDGDTFNFRGDNVVMDSLNPMECELGVRNVTRNPDSEPTYTTPEGYGIQVVLTVKDEDIIKLKKKTYKDTVIISIDITPLSIGTTDITAYLYITDTDGNQLEIVDAYTFTVTVEEFESEVLFEEGDFVPAENGYPYLLAEHKVGDNCYVQVWAEDETVKPYSGDGAVAVIAGTGDMWDTDTRREKTGSSVVGSNGYDCALKMYIQEGITSIHSLGEFSNLTEVEYPSTLKVIGKYCFDGTELLEVVLPDGVERIEESAYEGLETISRIELPSTLQFIGFMAFDIDTHREENSNNLVHEIVIPNSVKTIEYGAFGYRWGMKVILEKGTDTSGFEKGWDLIDSGAAYNDETFEVTIK